MRRAVIVGSGSEIAPVRLTNEQMARVMDTSDEWIRERSGVEERHFASPELATSDLGTRAAARALEHAGIDKGEVDMVVFATMTPDHYFPGCGTLLQAQARAQERAVLRHPPAVLGLPLRAAAGRRPDPRGHGADGAARRRRGPRRLHALDDGQLRLRPGVSDVPPTKEEYDWNTRFRHLVVLFGDAGSAVVLKAVPDGERGVIAHELHAAGADYDKLYVPGTGFKHRPYTDPEQFRRGDHIPVMDGRFVFKMATTRMVEVAQSLLQAHGVAPGDLKLALMHQANKRINEYCAKALGLREEQVPSNIHKYGNTTAATIPLLWDECVRGRPAAAGRPRAARGFRGRHDLGRVAGARLRVEGSPGRLA